MRADHGRDPGSFRDPSGYIFLHEGHVYRHVAERYAPDLEHLKSSGLLARLHDEELLVPHEEVDDPRGPNTGSYKVLKPLKLPFISYPYEWCFGQRKAAALLTIRIAELALEHGMILKDASAYNVQFQGTHPLFIDTLSFERWDGSSPWDGYGQFCRHFLAPLALQAKTHELCDELLRTQLDGIPLDFAAACLPWLSRFSPGLGPHVHLHARSTARHASDNVSASTQVTVTQQGLAGILDSLKSTIQAQSWEPGGTEWADYYNDTNYSDDGAAHKAELVTQWSEEIRPGLVWDLGANDGRYSRLAGREAYTVAFDVDRSAVEKGWRRAVNEGERSFLPLRQDLRNPSPSLGYASAERRSLTERGPADLLLSLALIHHLAIGNNVPLREILAYFSKLGTHVILEWVPKEDSQVQRLLASREDIFPDYRQDHLEHEMEGLFEVQRRVSIRSTTRILYLLRATV